MWRLSFLPWRKIGLGAAVVALLAAAGVVFAVTRGGGGKTAATKSTRTTAVTASFYVRALAAKTRVKGCTMRITFRWRPYYRTEAYIGTTAVIQVTGSGIDGTYRETFTRRGITFRPPPVSIRGGYQIWAARIMTLGGDAPGNDTTVQSAPPRSAKCH